MKSFKKIISTITAVMMLGAMAVMPAQAAEGVRVDPTTFYADADGIEVEVTSGTLDASDITLTKKSDGSTVTVTDVVTDGDVATIPVALEIGEKYIINIGDVERQFEITKVVNGINDLKSDFSTYNYNAPKGATIVDDEYFVQAAHLVIDGDAAETVKNLERYTLSYDYGKYDKGWAWGHRILWNAKANGTAKSPYPKDGYGFHMTHDTQKKDSYLLTVNLDTTKKTDKLSSNLYVNSDTDCGTATISGQDDAYTVTDIKKPRKYWPIKLKKNGAKGTLFIDGHEIYTYDPDSDAPTTAPTTGYFVLIQDNTASGSISNFLITTSKFAEIKDVTITDLYADADGVEFTSTGSTFTQEDVTLKTKAGETIGITSVTTADGITTVVPATALPADTDYVLTVGEGTKEFRITAVVNGINASTFKSVCQPSSDAGVKYDETTGELFMIRAAAELDGAAAETVKKLNRYTASYNLGSYTESKSWNLQHKVLWNSTDLTFETSTGYGYYMPHNSWGGASKYLQTVNGTAKTNTDVAADALGVTAGQVGTATVSGNDTNNDFALSVTTAAPKFPIKIKKNGAVGTLYVNGVKKHTYTPDAGSVTKGNFVVGQGEHLGSISGLVITTSDVIEPAVAPQIVGATRAGATVTFTVKGNTVESAWVGFALYGANNKFLGIASATYTLTTEGESKTLTVSGVNASDIVTAKMFMWDNITNSLKPLCNVVTPTAVN